MDEPHRDAEESDEIPRHTKPFRAWGAAQERASGPSVWERFTAWLGGLFSRSAKKEDASAVPPNWGDFGSSHTEEARARTSFDDLDAPWADPFPPHEERRSRRPSLERPSVENFQATWDGSYDSEEESVVAEEPTPEPVIEAAPTEPAVSADADPLWDTPTVSESIAPAPQPFAGGEVEEVWTPRTVESEAAPIITEAPKKPGFFARLFGRKKAQEAESAALEQATAAEWATDLAEASEQRDLEPADADFAEDIAASSVPDRSDFVEEVEEEEAEVAEPLTETSPQSLPDEVPSLESMEVEVEVDMDDDEPVSETKAEVEPAFEKRPSFIGRLFGRKKTEAAPTPSLDHSAADAANLAALLGPITPVEDAPVDDVPTEMIVAAVVEEEVVEEPAAEMVEEIPVDEPLIVVEEEIVVVEAEAAFVEPEGPVVEEELTVDQIPAAEPIPESPAKKPGFFSSLLRRVSRSQFIPKPEIESEPEPEPEPEPSIEAFVEEAAVVEEAAPVEDEAKWAPPVADVDGLFDDVEEKQIPVRPADAAGMTTAGADAAGMTEVHADAAGMTENALDSTQPFPAFRDARDDFAEEESADAVTDSGRPTEQVEIPAFDENEKTDEFEVAPAATISEATPGFFGRLFGKKVVEEAGAETAAIQTPHTIMEPGDDKLPFVLAKFRSFYNEIIRDKHQKSDVISGFATAIVSAAASDMADPEFAAQLLSKRLSEMLELQAAESNWTGGDAAKYYLEAQYAMVALADETFATIDWPGRPSWHKYMLEPRMYGTRGADLEFFKRIDKLLKDNPEPSKGARDLARVYLLVIASGFRGKFRVPNLKRPLAEYRRRLYEFSHRLDPLDLYQKDRRIFPDAVDHTLESRAVGRFSSRQKWIAAVLILSVLYAGVSHFAWTRLSAELRDVMSRIETTDANAGRTP